MKYLALLLSIIFIGFAYLQLNDPDPVLWVGIYMVPVYLGIRAFLQYKNLELNIVAIAMTLLGAYYAWSGISVWEGFNTENMAMKSINQELAREAVGLLIMAFAIFLYCFVPKRTNESKF